MYKVVVIDDEKWAISNIVHSCPFAECGFELVGAAAGAAQGLELINETEPDVVFVDIRMPTMTGIELIRQVQPNHPSIVYVLISGYAQFDYAKEGIQLGVFDYCLKPMTGKVARDLLQRLCAHLNERRPSSQPAASQDADALDEVGENSHFMQLLEYVNAHLYEPLSLSELAKKYFLSPNYCGKLFRDTTGETFSQYVRERRIGKACDYLSNTDRPITEIAQLTGFTNAYYFAHIFTKEKGVSPRKFRGDSRRAQK